MYAAVYNQYIGNYRIEYARTSRSACTKCKNRAMSWEVRCGREPQINVMIKSGELRLGTQALMRGIPVFFWNHWGCITSEVLLDAKNRHPEISQLDGYDELHEGDQEKLRKAWEEGKVADADVHTPEVVKKDGGQPSKAALVDSGQAGADRLVKETNLKGSEPTKPTPFTINTAEQELAAVLAMLAVEDAQVKEPSTEATGPPPEKPKEMVEKPKVEEQQPAAQKPPTKRRIVTVADPEPVNAPRQKTRPQIANYHNALQNAEMNRGSVMISGDFDFKFVEGPLAKAGVEKEGDVTVSGAKASVVLRDVKVVKLRSSQHSAFSVALTPSVRPLPLPITNTTPIRFRVTFRSSFVGRYEDRLEFTFEDTHLKQPFTIVRVLRAVIGDQTLHQELQPRALYVPRSRGPRHVVPDKDIIPGVKPPAQTAIRYIGRLPKAEIPEHLQKVLDNNGSSARVMKQVQKLMPAKLDAASYGKWFQALLWVEEHKMVHDLGQYDIMDASLQRHDRYYYLEVPGLAENRPSVLVGDRMLVQEQGSRGGKWFEGHVHVVRQLEVGLCFHQNFSSHYSIHKRFHVKFKLNRIPAQRQHRALESSFTPSRVFFPSKIDRDHLITTRRPVKEPIELFNRLIETNVPQSQAVRGVLAMQPGSIPFIVFGPPGTGKTVTMIEAIQQVLASNRRARIFACAPSNSAADIIALRLTDKTLFPNAALTKDQLFRFYAPSRHRNQCPDKLLDFTCTTPTGTFCVPSDMDRIKRFKVIVSTCVSSSFASGIGVPRGHFSHMFVDEAGQATEPEAVMGMRLLGDARTNFVLCGDPKQLGPVIRSTVAMRMGLETSLLERLMGSEAYDLRAGRDYCVIKLTKNFRSHASILKFPNERFYAAELEACANPKVIDSFLASSYLPSPKFPIVFHAVSGKDDREVFSPSFFNIDEVIQVKNYVQRLKQDRKFRTTDNDIGIIAPYHAQVMKLRAALRNVADGVKVGSVEEFQGQERRIIIISTVRSSKEFIEYDLRHTLGFVANPRRFNVSVTRAQALLIIVGDPQVLSLDPLWRSFLNYIHINGGWTGLDITWDPREVVDEAGGYDAEIRKKAEIDMNEFTKRMEEMTMRGVNNDEEADGEDADAGVDKPWRDFE